METAEKIANAQNTEYKIEGAYCCHIGCVNDADYQIYGDHFEDYTHMCKYHVNEYVREDDTVEKIKH